MDRSVRRRQLYARSRACVEFRSLLNKITLLRRLFELACRYSGQMLSYTKMLGQLQDAGNTTTLAHYLDLLAGAGMVCGGRERYG